MSAAVFTLTMPLNRIHNSNDRGHWSIASRQRAEMRAAAKAACADLRPTVGPVELTITFAFPDRRRRDLDNYSVKGAIDGAVDAYVITDDRSTVLCAVTRRPSAAVSPKGFAILTFTFEKVQESRGKAS